MHTRAGDTGRHLGSGSVKPKAKNKKRKRWTNYLCYFKNKIKLFCFSCTLLTSGSKFPENRFNDWIMQTLHYVDMEKVLCVDRIYFIVNAQKQRCEYRLPTYVRNGTDKNIHFEWIIEFLKFLAERSFPFCDSDETATSPHNGNYLWSY